MGIRLVSRKGAKARRKDSPSASSLALSFVGSLCVFAPLRDYFLPVILCCCSTFAWAGGGPESLLLVVNPQSKASLTIANHYAKLRDIPPDNLIYLPWDPKTQTTDIDTFRQKILLPILHTLNSRHLADQIDYVIYSSDYPTAVTLDSDVRKMRAAMQQSDSPGDQAKAKTEWPKQLAPVGSINSLTYLWQAVIAGRPIDLQLHDNYYLRMPVPELHHVPSAGFRGNRLYNPKGEVVATEGRRYFLSTMLGVTAGRGNSPEEVIDYLKRSAAADGTHPKGTIYFLRNGDIRSKVRQDFFPSVVEQLTKLGVDAKILEGTVPLNRSNVQGLVMGTPSFDWKASGSTILPGAICEHFTSFGGVMTAGAAQTPLTEFLRYGAAGASGTVTEPYAILQKFPLPTIQVHYARGCTLAEAFYQSVTALYQLLIVGDPLCRPWATIPKVSVAGIKPGAVVQGTLTLTPTATMADGTPVGMFGLIVDGVRVAACKPGETLAVDTTKLADGYHELRVVAVGPGPIESQGQQVVSARFNNHGRTIEASLATQSPLQSDKPLTITAKSPGSVGIVAIQGSRIIGRIAGEEGQIEVPGNILGAGPVRIRVAGLGSDGMSSNVMAQPLDLIVE